jgi:hypothetical protein
MINSTLVTGIWDLNRSLTTGQWSRGFDHYKSHFERLLVACDDIPMAIFIDPDNESLVWNNRNRSNTVVYHHKKEDFSGNFFPFFNQVQNIRNNDKWKDQAGWLRDSTQSSLEYYNPMVMSKMFLLNNTKVFNPFDTDYYFWIDGGLTNTVHPGYFSHDKILSKIENIINKFLFICFPYETTTEIHGFDINGMKKYAQSDNVNRVARGGFFGGHKEFISEANSLYYSLLNDSLSEGYMGTEESIFTIMTYLNSETYHYEKINSDGLINTFFENIKNDITDNTVKQRNNRIKHENNDIILYVNTFNTPKQLSLLINSFEEYDNKFLSKTKKILINNSTDSSTFEDYDNLCSTYDFEQIKNGNLGVCGARQFSAEHFSDCKSKYMFFFEDDMLLDLSNTKCNFGFSKHIDNFYDKIIRLMNIEDYDFIKFSFSEFYGHNGEQWTWHNVPQNLKTEYFGNCKKRPYTKFNNIKSSSDIPYVDGEIYYSNWPHIIGQDGNKKLFLDTKWEKPFEQTWMSHIYTLTKQSKVKPAILLSSPITHNRVYFYEGKDRKES